MTGFDYLVGLVDFLLVWGAAVATGALVGLRRLPWLRGAPRLLGIATFALTALIVAHLLPAVLGILGRPAVLVVSLALLGGAFVLPGAGEKLQPERLGRFVPSGRIELALAAASLAVVAVYVLAFTRREYMHAITALDATTFHLPGVARWIQSGSVWQNDIFVPGWAFGAYPNNGELIQLAAVLPWDNDAFLRFVNYPLLFLTGVAVYAIAGELRAPRAAALAASAACVAMPAAVVTATIQGEVDTLAMLSIGTGVLFLLRHFRTGRDSELVLAGIALGLAFGTKWYGVTYVALLIAVWCALRFVAGRRRFLLRRTAILGAVVLASGGFWLLRNLVEFDNPVFPAKVRFGGLTLFDAPPVPVIDRVDFSIAHYIGDPGLIRREILPQLHDSFQLAGELFVIGALLALGLGLARLRSGRERVDAGSGAAAGVAAAGLLLGVAYTFMPYSALGSEGHPALVAAATRYAMPAFVLLAAATAWLGGVSRILAIAVPLIALVACFVGLDKAYDIPLSEFPVALLLAASLALALGLAWRYAHRLLARPALAAALGAVIVIALAVGGWRAERSFNATRYREADPVLGLLQRAHEGVRVGLAGVWSGGGAAPVLPAFGPRYRNEVEYVGYLERHVLHAFPDRQGFLRRLRDGGFRLLVVGRFTDSGGTPREERWARAAGWTQRTQSERFTLLQAPIRAKGAVGAGAAPDYTRRSGRP